MPKPALVSSKLLFIIFLITIGVTSLTVFISGLDIKRSVYNNTLITLTILSIFFFLFLAVGLYFGLKLKDTVGRMTDKIKIIQPNGLSGDFNFSELIPVIEIDGIEGILIAILVWIVFSFGIIVLLFFFETILWASIVIFGAALYWIFFRATRMVLRKGTECKGKLMRSLITSLIYSCLYSSWIYIIVVVFHFWKK